MTQDNKSLHDALAELRDAWRELRDAIQAALPGPLPVAVLMWVAMAMAVVWGVCVLCGVEVR